MAAARTYDQIVKELNSTFEPQVANLRLKANAIPGQIANEENALRAKEQDYFDNTILGDARRRGLGFSGIPEGERARYGATEFLPALARLKQSGQEQALSLEDAILGVYERRNTLAQQIRQQEQDRYFQAREAQKQREFQARQAQLERDAQLRASRSAGGGGSVIPSFGGMPTPSGGSSGLQASRSQRKDGGFNFNIGGKPVSAATYAVATNTPFRTLLTQMAQAGDAGAKQALGFVGNDFGYDPRKVTTGALANIYNSLIWDTGKKQATYKPHVAVGRF